MPSNCCGRCKLSYRSFVCTASIVTWSEMLAYCTALGLSRGHLIYAKGNEQPTVHTVRRAGVTIHCHALDLSLTPPELLGRVNGLAASILTTPADN